MHTIMLDTKENEQFIDITSRVQEIIERANLLEGMMHLFCKHTTAGITINENADPDVKSDMLMALSHMVPASLPYRHAEGNSTAHLKASLFGCQLIIPVAQRQLQLGRWQGIYFCEFDGPRGGRSVEAYFTPASILGFHP